MKVYYGHAATEERAAYVTVRGQSQKAAVLPHHVRHSPTGFNWGYNGSGPGDLARSILLDAFGTTGCPSDGSPCQCENKWAEAAYPAYRDAVIAKLDQDDDWRLEQAAVTDWVFDYLKASAEVSREEALV